MGLCVFVTLVSLSGLAQGQDLLSTCVVRAAGDRADQLIDVQIDCPGWQLSAVRARLTGSMLFAEESTLRGDFGNLRAESLTYDGHFSSSNACLENDVLRCCALDVAQNSTGWDLNSVTCQTLSGLEFEADVVHWSETGLTTSGGSVDAGLPLPYPVGVVDHYGRSPGLVGTRLGYRGDREAASLEQGWFQPMGPRWDVRLGVHADTLGSVGPTFELRTADAQRRTRWLSLLAFWDPSTDTPFRLDSSADFTLAHPEHHFGVSIVGSLLSDGGVARDIAMSSLERQRPDRHLAAAAWGGGSTERVWFGLSGRGQSELPGSPAATPDIDFVGSQLAAGYLTTVAVERWAEFGAALRFDRWGGGQTSSRTVNTARLATGAEFRGLSSPALTFVPGLWAVFSSLFSDPIAGDFNEFHARTVATAELHSPWLGRLNGFSHLIDFGASARLDFFRYTESEGELSPLVSGARIRHPIAVQGSVEQQFLGDGFRLSWPTRWIGRHDYDGWVSSRATTAAIVDLSIGESELQIRQEADFDIDTAEFVGYTAGLAIRLGTLSSRTTTASEVATAGVVSFGGYVALQRSGTNLHAARPLVLSPLLTAPIADRVDQGVSNAGAWAAFDFGPIGVHPSVVWPLELETSPDLGLQLWLGDRASFSITLDGRYLSDETWLVGLALVPPSF